MNLKNYEKIESTNIEFKEMVEYNKSKSWLKSVSAFANSTGGTLLFGVRDVDKKPVGLDNVIKDSEKISELIKVSSSNRLYKLLSIELNRYSKIVLMLSMTTCVIIWDGSI